MLHIAYSTTFENFNSNGAILYGPMLSIAAAIAEKSGAPHQAVSAHVRSGKRPKQTYK